MLNFSLNLYKPQVNSNNILSSINNRNNVGPSLLFIHLLIPSLVLWLVRLSGRGNTSGQCGLALILRRNASASLCSAQWGLWVSCCSNLGWEQHLCLIHWGFDHEGMLDFTAAFSVCPQTDDRAVLSLVAVMWGITAIICSSEPFLTCLRLMPFGHEAHAFGACQVLFASILRTYSSRILVCSFIVFWFCLV